MKKINYLDSLRGIAIIGVVMIHVSLYGKVPLPNFLNALVSKGMRGVQLFFMVSAFTLYLSYNYHITHEKNHLKNFYLRRFFRIAPMYFIGIIYYLFQDGLGERYYLGDQDCITKYNILSNFTFIHGFNPYWINSVVPGGWSIAIEMTFYLIFPLIFHKIKSLNNAFKLFFFSMISSLLLAFIFHKFQLIPSKELWSEYLVFYFPSQFPVFSIGIVAYFLVIEKQKINSISPIYLIFFIVMLLLQLGYGNYLFFSNHILFSLAFLGAIVMISKVNFTLFVNPITNFIGKLSFSLYLVHFAVLHWLEKWDLVNYFNKSMTDYFIRLLLTIVLSVLISFCLYKLIEQPFIRIGKRIISKFEN